MILVYIILTLLLTLIFHELGHVLSMAWINGEFPEIKLGWREIVIDDGNETLRPVVYLMGIVGGLFPLVSFFWFNVPGAIILILLYFVGCKYDIKQLFKKKEQT